VMFPRPSTNRNLIERKAKDRGFTLHCAYESSSAVVQLEFARLGLASSILPHFAFADQLSTHGLIATPIKGLTISQTLVWRSDRRQPAIVAEVAEAIRTIMRSRRTPLRHRRRTGKRNR
jgi:DNA-binding transcriptional LysR family regulator